MDDLAALGPFFAVETHDFEERPPTPWQLFSTLLDGDALDRRVIAVRAALAVAGRRQLKDIEVRVAVSVAQLGLVARIIAPVVASPVLGRDHLATDPENLWWQDRLGGPFPLSVSMSRGPQSAVGQAVEALTVRAAGRFGVSEQVLWGNVGSAANSAAGMIREAQPDLADAARIAADAILADPRIDAGRQRASPDYRRTSCCLIYRVSGDRSAVCGDCVLRAA